MNSQITEDNLMEPLLVPVQCIHKPKEKVQKKNHNILYNYLDLF